MLSIMAIIIELACWWLIKKAYKWQKERGHINCLRSFDFAENMDRILEKQPQYSHCYNANNHGFG